MPLLKFSEFSQDDMTKYFHNTLVRVVDPTGGAKWFVYEGLASQGHQFRASEKKKTGLFYIPPQDLKNFKVDVCFPVGYFNTKRSAVWCQREGIRGPSKGLSAGNNYEVTSVETLLSRALKNLSDEQCVGLSISAKESKLTPELAQFMFEDRVYFPILESVIDIRKGKMFARALSENIAIAPHHACKDLLVLFQDYPVAEFFSKTRKIKMLMPEYEEEIVSFFTPQGIAILS